MLNNKQELVFETQVIEVGQEAQDFSAINMLILFGQEAPDALRSSCYIINVQPVKAAITTGMQLKINDTSYQITAVGDEVQRNLTNLGHIAISFTGKTTAELPGTLYVEQGDYPVIEAGAAIAIGTLR
ncbi:PTS sorbitol transporter subunit IIA [Lactobacillus sp. CBA3605]|uniref:PTS glucitol/sorbitol transporter subunit IIA n=1 Tax=Lactobacillus sp. CBA3605 TaxID=2099788 RepID=UPI000CFCBFE2|nr:PTS glucitol/sorbitol transporter subunit IIA [Lactobacillus sp. CBA3605]AVK60659.1 PTS sorbitol transporter subunit IIA [Lactobacillus sp. CBA3605]